MKLVIVESPAKCQTISKYLGKGYLVEASYGHIRDLATCGKGGLGVDVENGFAPTYKVSKEKRQRVGELTRLAKKADEVILATDPDREGEAIAWHLAQVLGLDVDTNKRLEFHSITRDSISEAMANPRVIDKNLVSAQETRRIIDRIIGFKLSTLIYSRIKSKSAGRVQSATLKLIVDLDKEIKAFVPEEYYKLKIKGTYKGKEYDFTFLGSDSKKDIKTKEEADQIVKAIGDSVKVIDINKKIKLTESKAPFTTSTLQQEAFSKLKFKTKKTQSVAQSLYEGINVNGEHVGLITYIRTDSTLLSSTYVKKATDYVLETYGKEYLGNVKTIKNSALAQEAHEAIRPTSNHRTPESVRAYLNPDQFKLYELIYNRAVGSLLKPKKEEITTFIMSNNSGYKLSLEFSKTIFNGYEVLFPSKYKEEHMPDIAINDEFYITNKEIEQKFTEGPTPYTEAKLVKAMDELGIGRPSTYASTIDTLVKRSYVTDKGGVLTPTEQGIKTIHVLEKYFDYIVDIKYTAKMENELDGVETGEVSSLDTLNSFYNPFIKRFDKVKDVMYKDDPEYTGEYCPKCGAPLIKLHSKNGDFVGCSNFPKCNYIQKEAKPAPIETGELCPKCGKPLVERVDRKGRKFVACSGYPKCSYIVPSEKPCEPEVVKTCPKCGGNLIKKKGKYGYFLGCSNYPTCNYMEKISKKRGNK